MNYWHWNIYSWGLTKGTSIIPPFHYFCIKNKLETWREHGEVQHTWSASNHQWRETKEISDSIKHTLTLPPAFPHVRVVYSPGPLRKFHKGTTQFAGHFVLHLFAKLNSIQFIIRIFQEKQSHFNELFTLEQWHWFSIFCTLAEENFRNFVRLIMMWSLYW